MKQIEQAVLFSAIQKRNNLFELMEYDEEIFQDLSHRRIFQVLVDMFNAGKEICLTSAHVTMIDCGMEKDYLALITESATAPSIFDIKGILEKMKENADKNKIKIMAKDIYNLATKNDLKYEEFIDKIYEIKNEKLFRSTGAVDFSKLNTEQLDDIFSKSHYVPSGFKSLDELLHGFFCGQTYIIAARPGQGKCERFDQKVIMYNGSIKRLDELRIGDELMGIDSNTRTIKYIHSGHDYLYEIKQKKGNNYYVRDNHILSLKSSGYDKEKTGTVVNISTKDFLKKSRKFQIKHKGYKCDLLEFEKKEIALNPYFLGIWIGDGDNKGQRITNPDIEIEKFLIKYSKKIGMRLHKHKSKDRCLTLSITNGKTGGKENIILNELRKLNLLHNKHIPDIYKINIAKIRLEILAGLIDSDGYKISECSYEIITKYEKLKDDILFLCGSLGFNVRASKCKKGIKRINFIGDYYRIYISGDVYKIPCKIKRKKCIKAKRYINTKVGEIKISKRKIKEKYIGIQLDGDGLYIHDDFTVTHNTAIAMQIARQMNTEVLFFSLEMKWAELYARCLSCDADTMAWKIEAKKMTDAEFDRVMKSHSKPKQKITVIDDHSSLLPMISTIRKYHSIGMCKAVIIDYIQLVVGSDGENQNAKLSTISRTLKNTAMSLNIPIIFLSQLNRDIERTKREPSLADLRDSGSLEQDATGVIFLHRKERDDPLRIIVAKNRKGKHGIIDNIRFEGEFVRFVEDYKNEKINPEYFQA